MIRDPVNACQTVRSIDMLLKVLRVFLIGTTPFTCRVTINIDQLVPAYCYRQDVAMKNHSILHIFFGDLVSIQYRCDAYYNWFTLFGESYR